MKLESEYVSYEKNITQDGYKLLCIPYAGGGASFFCDWYKYFNSTIEVLPIQLPGRENRMGDQLINNCVEVAGLIVDSLENYVETNNFSVLGHSMGGIIAFETVREFERRNKKPDMCFISASTIEDMSGVVSSRTLNNKDFFKRVSQFGGIDETSEILKYPEFVDIFMGILRSDFELIEDYRYDGGKIECPIVATCGDSDPMESLEKMKKWVDFTYSEVEFREFNGGHFYLKDNKEAICKYIERIIENRRR